MFGRSFVIKFTDVLWFCGGDRLHESYEGMEGCAGAAVSGSGKSIELVGVLMLVQVK